MSNIYGPPRMIDGATVLEFAWSGDAPFGVVSDTRKEEFECIHGLAICRYVEEGGSVYRFACNKNWETVQDADYASVDEAKMLLPEQYKHGASINWQPMGGNFVSSSP